MAPMPACAPSEGSTPALRVADPLKPLEPPLLEIVTVPVGGKTGTGAIELVHWPVVGLGLQAVTCALFSTMTLKTVGWPATKSPDELRFRGAVVNVGSIFHDGEGVMGVGAVNLL